MIMTLVQHQYNAGKPTLSSLDFKNFARGLGKKFLTKRNIIKVNLTVRKITFLKYRVS